MNEYVCSNSELVYSRWHRSLGYSYFAMDIDYVEIRDNKPVAIIEASLCTESFPECDSCNGVFNRFLRETGGFQFDLVYWVSRWLKIPAFLVCMKPLQNNNLNGKIHILSFSSGESVCVDIDGYKNFIENLPDVSYLVGGEVLELPLLLDKLKNNYPGLKVYPYFKPDKLQQWQVDYEQRLSEIDGRKKRERPMVQRREELLAVKKETTGQRLRDYENIRKAIGLPYFNLKWVEWRKDDRRQTIGRPAALVKTCAVKEPVNFESNATQSFELFSLLKECIWWEVVSKSLLVNWYFVSYHTVQNDSLGNEFIVWRNDRIKKKFNLTEYTGWVKSL